MFSVFKQAQSRGEKEYASSGGFSFGQPSGGVGSLPRALGGDEERCMLEPLPSAQRRTKSSACLGCFRALGGGRRAVYAWAASTRSAGEDGEGFAAGEEADVGEGAAQFDARGGGKRRAAAARTGAFSGKAQRLLDQDGGPSEGADQRQPVKLILLAEGGVAAEEGKAEPVRFLRDEVCKRGDDALASQRENSRRFPVAGGIYGQRTAARGPNVGDPRNVRPVLNGSADVRQSRQAAVGARGDAPSPPSGSLHKNGQARRVRRRGDIAEQGLL